MTPLWNSQKPPSNSGVPVWGGEHTPTQGSTPVWKSYWTPDSLMPRIWLDAAIGSGQIYDRSEFSHIISTHGNAQIDNISGLPALGLPPGSWLSNESLSLNPPFTLAFVGRHYSVGKIRHLFDSGDTGIPTRITLRHLPENCYQCVTRGIDEGDGDIENLRTPAGSADLGTDPFVVIVGSNSNQSFVRVNGGKSVTVGTLGVEGFRGLYVGRRWFVNESLWFDGVIGEFFAFLGAPSIEVIEKIEGYLFWKWQFQKQIQAIHPWAATRPLK